VVFYPDAFARLTGVVPASLQDEEADAGTLLPDEWSEWPAALGALAKDADAQQRWIVDWLTPRWLACREHWAAATPPRLAAHLRRPLTPRDTAESSAGVAELAELLALGERQLRRQMQAATGLSPVQWQRIQRASGAFIKARDALAQGQPLRLAELAAEFGYADQAHLTRELQALCGLPAARLLQAAQHAPDYWPFRL
jgi:AraC-type DNA-binding domain-containing proteins